MSRKHASPPELVQVPEPAPSESEPRPTRIGIVGAGWVGLVTGACFANLGYEVVLQDIDARRLGALRNGLVPFYEPGLDDLLERNRERMRFTNEIADAYVGCAVTFVCVGTPPSPSGDADLSAVWAVIDALPAAPPGERPVLVMKSTVPVGTGAQVRLRLDASGRHDVAYASNPEFLAEGTAIRDFTRPDRVVVGAADPEVADRVAALYEPLGARIVRADVASAEMIKLASNAFLATRISFVNEIANVCEQTGADVELVAEGMGLDRRIGPHFLRAGIGYGGSCFGKDVAALKQLAGNTGYHFQLLAAAIEVNELQKRRLVGKLKKQLGTLKGKRIALLGLAFKPNTNDMRGASSIVVSARLLAEGAQVRAWDPAALDAARDVLPGVELVSTVLEAVAGADAAVIVTEWEQLRHLPTDEVCNAMRTPVIVDGRNLLDPERARAAGFTYTAIGRPDPAPPAAATESTPDLSIALGARAAGALAPASQPV